MATKNATASQPTLEQVRALLAQMERQAEKSSKLGPVDAFCADLDDHRVDPRALAAFVRKVAAVLKGLGVDLNAEDQDAEDQDDAPPPVDAPPVDAPAPVDLTPANGEKGKK